MPTIIKKYSNRRLYDTSESRYITQDELAQKIRGGMEPQVVDVKSGEDLTQATLAQIIIESRGAGRLLPVPLLIQLIRMEDSALAEFLGYTLSWALTVYQQARQNMQQMNTMNPFAAMGMPYANNNPGMNPFMSMGMPPWMGTAGQPTPPTAPPQSMGSSAPPPPPASSDKTPAQDATQVDDLRREIEALKDLIKGMAQK